MPAPASQHRRIVLAAGVCLMAAMVTGAGAARAQTASTPGGAAACGARGPAAMVAAAMLQGATEDAALRADASSDAGIDPALADRYFEAIEIWTRLAAESCASDDASDPRTPRADTGAPPSAEDDAQDAAVWSRTGQTPRPIDSEIP